jgi:hypothetical protein
MRWVHYGIFGSIVLIVLGCSSKPVEPTYPPVTGKVTLNEKPLVGAVVTFIPVGSTVGNTVGGGTDQSGQYNLQGPRGSKGAAPGEYKVVISQWLMPDGTLPQAGLPPANSGAVESLPAIYSDPAKTTLKATVPAAGGNFDFALKKK